MEEKMFLVIHPFHNNKIYTQLEF